MKGWKIMASVMAAAAVAAVSCDSLGSETEWDIAPIVLQVYLNDEDGTNLLNPSVDGNIVGNGITAVFKDSTYTLNDTLFLATKALFPDFYGLALNRDSYGKYCLTFGELSGEDNLDNEDLVIYWGDGTSDTITVYNKFKWSSVGDPKITRRFYLNGERTTDDISVFKIVK